MSEKKRLYEGFNTQLKTYDGGEVPIEYLLTGKEDGETILFIHGLCMNVTYFYPNIIHFIDRYRVLVLTLRGHGNSGIPQPESLENYSFGKNSEDIKSLVDHLGIKKFHCVGASMGGMIAQDMIDRHPEYFLSITTVGTPPKIGFPRWLTSFVTKPFYKLVSLIGVKRYAKVVANQVGKGEAAKEYLYNTLVKMRPGGNFHSRVNAAGYSHVEKIRNIKVPYLLVMGTMDKFMNRRMGPMIDIYKNNSKIELETIKGAGHCPNLDFPVEFNKMLDNFLNTEY
ncbi:alpha/beta fold hydrolase [candidate division KSB1 bacterium]